MACQRTGRQKPLVLSLVHIQIFGYKTAIQAMSKHQRAVPGTLYARIREKALFTLWDIVS
jgi:hypothetical protein